MAEYASFYYNITKPGLWLCHLSVDCLQITVNSIPDVRFEYTTIFTFYLYKMSVTAEKADRRYLCNSPQKCLSFRWACARHVYDIKTMQWNKQLRADINLRTSA